MKLFLIIDKHEAYRDYKIDKTLEEWGTSRKNLKTIDTIKTTSGMDLFGDTPVSIITFYNNLDGLKKMIETITKMSKQELEESFPEGLIISTDAQRNSTKKLEKFVEEIGGTLSLMTPDKDSDKMSLRFVNELNLTKPVKELLLSYVGDDYETLIPLVKTLSKIPKNKHKNITEEDILVRLPQAKGKIKPWDVMNKMDRNDLSGAIESARRVFQHSYYLVLLTMMKNQYQGMYRIGILSQQGCNDNEIKEITGVNNVGVLKNKASKIPLAKLQRIVNIVSDTETKVKGGSSVDGENLVELMIMKIMKMK